jgi:hypothetical protein
VRRFSRYCRLAGPRLRFSAKEGKDKRILFIETNF